jgi:hypothetical protein
LTSHGPQATFLTRHQLWGPDTLLPPGDCSLSHPHHTAGAVIHDRERCSCQPFLRFVPVLRGAAAGARDRIGLRCIEPLPCRKIVIHIVRCAATLRLRRMSRTPTASSTGWSPTSSPTARSAIRDAARVLGHSPGQQDTFGKAMDRWGGVAATAAQPGHGIPDEVLDLAARSRTRRGAAAFTPAAWSCRKHPCRRSCRSCWIRCTATGSD